MDIELNASDIKAAAHFADLFQQNKSRLQAGGIVKNNKVSNQSDFGVMYIGLLGELAVSKLLGIAIRTDVTVGGDGALDMLYGGYTLQIKTTSHAVANGKPRYLIFNRINEFAADLAVLCAVKNAYTIQVIGFATRTHFTSRLIMHNFGYGDKFCLPENELTAIERLQETIATDITEEII